jgi:3-phenylpropionate/trans-cinnamate dioxygenase ferredoxin component
MSETTVYDYYLICKKTDLPDGERLFVDINNVPVVIFNIGGSYYAMDDVCTHDDGPVGEGDLDGFVITCPRHGAQFDVRSGKVLSPPAVTDDRIYPVILEGDEIKIGLQR